MPSSSPSEVRVEKTVWLSSSHSHGPSTSMDVGTTGVGSQGPSSRPTSMVVVIGRTSTRVASSGAGTPGWTASSCRSADSSELDQPVSSSKRSSVVRRR